MLHLSSEWYNFVYFKLSRDSNLVVDTDIQYFNIVNTQRLEKLSS